MSALYTPAIIGHRIRAIFSFVILLCSQYLFSQSTKSINVNIFGGVNPYNNTAWNNWNCSTAGTASPPFKYNDGSNSAITATLSDSYGISDNGTGYGGTVCPPEVLRYTSYTTSKRTLTFNNLNPGILYSFDFYASRARTDGQKTIYTIGGQSVTVNTDNNKTETASFNNIQPNVNGQIIVSITRTATYNYLNGFIIRTSGTGGNQAPVADAGPDQVIFLPVNTVQLNGSGSDIDGTIVSYEWTKLSGGSATINSPHTSSTSITNLVEGNYVFRLTVTDNLGLTGINDINITVNAALPPCIGSDCFLPPSVTDSINCGKAFKIVVLGSSTAAGEGASNIDSSWVEKFTKYIKSKNPSNQLVNLAASALTTYEVLCPSDYVPPPNRPAPVPYRNITAALSLNPNAIIINLPSNDAYYGYSLEEQINNYERAMVAANNRNVPVWVATTQPRNLPQSGINLLTAMRDWTYTRFGTKAIDFWTTLANPDGTINSFYDTGDHIHFNNYAHHIFYTRTVGHRILDSLCLRSNQPPPNIPPTVSAGNNQSITLPVTSVTLTGNANDPDGSIISYLWTKQSGGNATINNAAQPITLVTKLELGTYVFRLTVTDNKNATAYSEVTVTVNPAIPPSGKSINVNIFGGVNPYNNTAWNNWNCSAAGTASPPFKYSDGSNSAITATLSDSYGISDNGTGYGGTVCPPEVLRYTSYTTSKRTLTFNNLNPAILYSFDFYASRARTDGQKTIYTIGGQSVTVNTDNNKTETASFNNIQPNANGQIIVGITRTNTYNYLNGFKLTEILPSRGRGNNEKTTKNSSQPADVKENFSKNDKVVHIYPLPLGERINISIEHSKWEKGFIDIYNENGKLIKQVQYQKSDKAVVQQIELNNLSSGLYFIRIKGNGWSKLEKIVKL